MNQVQKIHHKDRFTAFSNPDMLHGPIWGSMVSFAIPVFLSMLFQSLYSMVDSLIVGHALGENAYAAVGAGATLCELFIVFATGVGLGMSMVIARHFGANDSDKMKKSTVACMVIGFFFSVLGTCIGLFFLEDVLLLLNTPTEIFSDACTYSKIILVNIFACFFYNIFCGMLKALGNSFIPLLYLLFSSLFNIALDLLFVLGFHRGVAGVAEATALSQVISAILSGCYILKKCPSLIPEREHFRVGFGIYMDVFWTSLSLGVMNAIVMFGTLILQYAINSLGTLTIVAHTAARKLYSLGVLPISALCSSVSMFVSQNYGAKQFDRIHRSLRHTYLFSLIYAVVIFLLYLLFSKFAMALITGSTNEEVITSGVRYLCFGSPFFSVLGVLVAVRNSLQAVGSKILPILSSVIELVGKAVFTFVFVPQFGYWAVIVCEPLIWCAMTIELVISFYTRPEIKAHKKSFSHKKTDKSAN